MPASIAGVIRNVSPVVVATFQKPGSQRTNNEARIVATAMRMVFLTVEASMPLPLCR
jgi:hypothetical protein